jgi:hypothetical protein
MAHCEKQNLQNIHPQLIHMTLQEGLVIKTYNKIIYKVKKTTLEP